MNFKKTLSSGLILFVFAALLFIGCEQKDTDTRDDQTQPQPVDTPAQQTPAQTDTAAEQAQIPDLTGEWTGDFGERKMTLNITSQDGNTFEGETVVRWDSPKREKISGEVNFDTREMKITETRARKNNGNYTGTISADMTKFIGVWRDNGNRITHNITLTKNN
jgi:hypothetical protein